jgi:tetratricopeptide (TPR) repeat protein
MEFKDVTLDNFRFIGNTIEGVEICIEGVWLKKTMIGFSEDYTHSLFVFSPLEPSEPKAQRFLKQIIALPIETIEALFSIREKLKDDYEELVNEGKRFLDNGETHKAITCFGKAISLNASKEEAYSNLANAYDELGEYKKAIIASEKAREINSHNPDNCFNLGIIFKNLSINPYQDQTKISSEDKIETATTCFLNVSYWGDNESSNRLKQKAIVQSSKEENANDLLFISPNKIGKASFRSA